MYAGRTDFDVVRAFQHPRVAIHDVPQTIRLMRLFLERAISKRNRFSLGLFRRQMHIVFHLLEPWEGGITDIERSAFYDLARGIGATRYFLWDSTAELSDAQVLEIAQISLQGAEFGYAH
jgi:hypothetical protein